MPTSLKAWRIRNPILRVHETIFLTSHFQASLGLERKNMDISKTFGGIFARALIEKVLNTALSYFNSPPIALLFSRM